MADEVSLFSDDDIGAELETIRHVSHPDHFRDHEAWLQREQKSSIRGADLVAQASVIYPNVELGLDARKELAALSGVERHFRAYKAVDVTASGIIGTITVRAIGYQWTLDHVRPCRAQVEWLICSRAYSLLTRSAQ